MTSRRPRGADGAPVSRRGESWISAPRPSVTGTLLRELAVVTWPCHLPLSLAVLGGTSVAGVLSQHFGLTVLGLTLIFVPELLLGSGPLGGLSPGRRDRARAWSRLEAL